jgi:hypothetical protein
MNPIAKKIRAIIDKMELHQAKKFLHMKGNNSQKEDTTHKMGENCQI